MSKMSCQKWRVREKDKGDGHMGVGRGEASIEGDGFKPSPHYGHYLHDHRH